MRRETRYIVVHCSATPPHADIGADEIRSWHMAAPLKWRDIGYHAVIRRNGKIEFGRAFDSNGAHVQGWNTRSVGVCLVGGVDETGKPDCNFNVSQSQSLDALVSVLRAAYPGADVVGHRDLSPDLNGDGIVDKREWMKACPSFSVNYWLATGKMQFEDPRPISPADPHSPRERRLDVPEA